MRILHCLYDHEKNPWVGGGATRRLSVLRSHLSELGHTIEVVSGAFPNCEQFASSAYPVQFVGSSANYLLSTFSYARAARRVVLRRHAEFDLVVEDFAPWNPLFIAERAVGPKLIELQSFLGRQIVKKYWLAGLPFQWLERGYPRKFSHRISISEQIGRYPTGTTRVIPNGVEPGWLELKAPKGDYIAFMGRLDYGIKGIDTLVNAARRSNLPIRIAGDGGEKDRLRADIERLDNVDWVGWLNETEMVEFLQKARFVVAPSRSEGQNMIVMNAAALGKPSIVSDIAGLRYVTDSGFGLAFPVNSAEALASQMKMLWENNAECARLGGVAREFARTMTWPVLAREYASFCEQVIRAYRDGNHAAS